MPQYTAHHASGVAPITLQASAAVTGGRIVAASGNSTCAPAGAASTTVAGVAAHDAAIGDKVAVWPLPGVVHEVTGTGIVAAGDMLATAVNGTVAPIGAGTFGQAIGRALAGAADGATVRFIGL